MATADKKDETPRLISPDQDIDYQLPFKDYWRHAGNAYYSASDVESHDCDLSEYLTAMMNRQVEATSDNRIDRLRSSFNEVSHSFSHLTRITRDCIERQQLMRGYATTLQYYSFTCLFQLYILQEKVAEHTHLAYSEARIHKGHILFELASLATKLKWPWHASYFLILAFIEDVLSYICITRSGEKEEYEGHDLFRSKSAFQKSNRFKMLWSMTGTCECFRRDHALSATQAIEKIQDILRLLFQQPESSDKKDSEKPTPIGTAQLLARGVDWKHRGWDRTLLLFPEWVFGRCSSALESFLASPSSAESSHQPINPVYWAYLSRNLSESSEEVTPPRIGKDGIFEEMARYACETIPGVRVTLNSVGPGGEVDLIGFISSHSRFLFDTVGPYFFGECKWTGDSMPITDMEKIAGRSQRNGCRSFLCFSRKGIAGDHKHENGVPVHANAVLVALAAQGVVGIPISGDDLQIGNSAELLEKHLSYGLDAMKFKLVDDYPRVQFSQFWRSEYEQRRLHWYVRIPKPRPNKV